MKIYKILGFILCINFSRSECINQESEELFVKPELITEHVVNADNTQSINKKMSELCSFKSRFDSNMKFLQRSMSYYGMGFSYDRYYNCLNVLLECIKSYQNIDGYILLAAVWYLLSEIFADNKVINKADIVRRNAFYAVYNNFYKMKDNAAYLKALEEIFPKDAYKHINDQPCYLSAKYFKPKIIYTDEGINTQHYIFLYSYLTALNENILNITSDHTKRFIQKEFLRAFEEYINLYYEIDFAIIYKYHNTESNVNCGVRKFVNNGISYRTYWIVQRFFDNHNLLKSLDNNECRFDFVNTVKNKILDKVCTRYKIPSNDSFVKDYYSMFCWSYTKTNWSIQKLK